MKKRRSQKQTVTTKSKWSKKSGGIDLKYLRPLLVTLDIQTLEQLRKEVSIHISNKKNSTGCTMADLDGDKKDYNSNKFSYLSIIEDDWSYLFDNIADDGLSDYYVYTHTDPRTSNGLLRFSYESIGFVELRSPIYVGMGRGNRCNCFKRSDQHQNLLRKLLDLGYVKTEIVHIVSNGLTKQQALELESKLILYFGCVCKTKKRALSNSLPCLYNHRYEPYPDKYNALKEKAHSEFNIVKGAE